MPITSHGGVTGSSQSSGPLNLVPSSACEPGDFVTLCFVLRNNSQVVNTPSGWSLDFSTVANTNRLQLFSRIATGYGSNGGGTEPNTSFAWPSAGSASYWAMSRTWAGVDTADPYIVAPNEGAGSSGASVIHPDMSPGAAGLAMWWWIAYFGTGLQTGPKTITPPAGLDQQSSVLRAAQALGYVGIQGSLAVPSGSTGTKTATVSASSSGWRSMGLVLREFSAGPPPARGGDHFHTLAA